MGLGAFKMAILVTGAAGYIGSHAATALLEAGYSVVAMDNITNGDIMAIEGIKTITKKDFTFYEKDMRDKHAIDKIFFENDIDCIMHFAGLKAVGESVANPYEYYKTNVRAAINLCYAMKKHSVKKLIFSSSATVYKSSNVMPLTEDSELGASNPYGWSKLMCEQIFRDVAAADNLSIVLLRYFNPVGAHESGIIGENPKGTPNNLMPYIVQVAQGLQSELKVFGSDYDTPDGTCVRDYVHIMDLIKGHMKAIDYCGVNVGCEAFNLGTGKGVSVLQMIKAFEQANGLSIAYSIAGRRAGDNAVSYGSTEKAERALGFKAEYSLHDMCKDSWNYAKTTAFKTHSCTSL